MKDIGEKRELWSMPPDAARHIADQTILEFLRGKKANLNGDIIQVTLDGEEQKPGEEYTVVPHFEHNMSYTFGDPLVVGKNGKLRPKK